MGLFGKKGTGPPSQDPASSAADHALRGAIAGREKADPLIRAKIGGKAVAQHFIELMKSERGVHVESLLSVLGALGGFACQLSLWATAGGKFEGTGLEVAETKDGKKYFFGNSLNRVLLEDPTSIWGLTGGMAQHLGAKSLPDIPDIIRRAATSLGTEAFGVPIVPDAHKAHDLPINYVRHIWPTIAPKIKVLCGSGQDLPMIFGFAIQNVMEMGKETIDPGLAARIVMESAIPMSKVDPTSI
jgi:hypothetical protein